MVAILSFLVALAVSYAGTRLLLRRPPSRAFVDMPNERSSHDSPKPRFGGIAIVGAFFVAFGAACLAYPPLRAFLPLAGGCAVLFATGILDDWRGLGVGAKLGAQLVAALIAIAAGNVLHRVALPVAGVVEFSWFAYPLTAIVFIAGVNFYNFIDGIDGLAAGGGFIAGAFLAVIAAFVGQPAIAVVALIAAGAALGFLQFNFPPSKLFMGDSGSTFFGYCFAYLAVAGNQSAPAIPFFVSMLLVASLYLDAALTIVNRLARGERVFQPHRMHYYQRLLQLGLNHKQVTLLEYLVLILLGASALLYVRAGALFGPFVSVAWVTAFVLAILKIRALERGSRLFWERRALFVIVTDLAAIALAYFGAYFLRMNFEFTKQEGNAVLRAFPIVMIVRSACFFKYGLYRSMWRYTSVADVIRVIKAVTAGSAIILAAVVLLYRFVAFPRTLFVIEYFLLISLVLGVRFSTRLFHEIGREPHSESARRYGVIGAGDDGERAAREINARGPGQRVVCFIEDDARKRGLTLHGVPVEGPGADLGEICRRRRVDALVYALSGAGEDAAMVWLDRARAADVPLEGAPRAAGGAEPRALLLDRVASALGRPAPATSPRVAAALRSRRVLITHGGGSVGGSLITMVRAAEGIPILHHETSGGWGEAASSAARAYGSLVADADGLVEGVAADAVVHAVRAVAPGGVNDDEFIWSHLVRETDAVARAVWRRPGRPLVVVCEWDAGEPGDRALAVAAVMEAVVLNRAGAEPVAVVRVPRVLTAGLLEEGASGGTADVLEGEVARIVLEVVAGGFRGIYVPAPAAEIDVSAARRAAAAASRTAMPAQTRVAAAPVFPSEHLDECGVEGARRVLSPLFPAADPFRRLAAAAPVAATAAERDEWLRAVAAQVYQVSGSGEGVFRG
jgi:UDP-N-acetylmuramyl pentapeptide phosphotransferase/UDP-N-acetylglucosamine-1-phosphate transferase